MKLEHDRNGFLTGSPPGDDDAAERLLGGIKGDTSEMLGVIRRTSSESAAQPQVSPRSPTSPRAPARANALPTAVPAGRASAAPAVAAAVAAALATLPQARQHPAGGGRPPRLPTQVPIRDARGRFVPAANRRQPGGGDGEPGGGARDGRGLAGAAAGATGQVLDRARNVDPLLGSIGEVRSLAHSVGSVVTPVGRMGTGLFSRGNSEGTPVGLLRRVWRELRGLRKDEAKAAKDTKRALAKAGGGAAVGGDGGGLFTTLATVLPAIASALPGLGVLGKALTSIAAIFGGAGGASAAGAGLKGIVRRLPVIGPLIEAVTGVIEDQRIANDGDLSESEKRTQRYENAGQTGGAMAGALAGGLAGSALGPVGAVVGAGIGALTGGALGKRVGGGVSAVTGPGAKRGPGFVSATFESGGDPGAISSGKGDFGGKSYGTHQLAVNTGTLQSFLATSSYGPQFAGLVPGSPEFDAQWKSIAASDPNFGQAQHDFIQRTHVDPMMARLKAKGIDLSGRGQAVQEAVFSTANAMGPNSNLIERALAGSDLPSMSEADIVSKIQDYKIANNASLYRSSSPTVQASLLNRHYREKSMLLGIAGAQPGGLTMPATPPIPSAPVIGAAPSIEGMNTTRVNSPAAPAISMPLIPPGQDVRDRTIAHIVTGGIGWQDARR